MDEIAGVILVGGKSSRMGRDKAQLPWHGARLVDSVAAVLRQAGISRLYVSGVVEGYDCIPDIVPSCGPVAGICASVERLYRSYAHAVFVPVDMPFLSATCVKTLLRPIDQCQGYYFEGHPLPCVLKLNNAVYEHTRQTQRQLQSGGECSVKYYLSGLSTCSIIVAEDFNKALTNTNTPQEWEEAHHEFAHG